MTMGSDLSLWLASPPPCIAPRSVKRGILLLLLVQASPRICLDLSPISHGAQPNCRGVSQDTT